MTSILNRDEKTDDGSDDNEPLSNLVKHGKAKRSVERREGDKKASEHSPDKNAAPKRRDSPRKTDKVPVQQSSDGSDDEPLTELVKKKLKRPQMKQAVVLLEKMSRQDLMDLITQKNKHNREGKSTRRSAITLPENEVESSDDEPLSRKLKRLKEKNKRTRDRKAKPDASSDDEPLVKTEKATDKSRK